MAHDGRADGPDGSAAPGATVPHRRRARRLAGLTVGAVVLVAAGLGGALVHDAFAARAALQRAAAAIPRLEQSLRTTPGDAQADLAALQADTAEAASRTSGPLWELAARLPGVGGDVAALATIADTVDHLATEVLPRLSVAADALAPERLAPRDGRIDVAAVEAVRDDVVAADVAVTTAVGRLAAIERDGLAESLRDAADQVQDELAEVSRSTATAARAVELIPPMLGSDGPRQWLVLAQNNAEPRATGGIPGAVLSVRADDGRVELAGAVPAADFGTFTEPVLPLTDSEQALFGPGLGRWVQDVTFTPDFPRTGELATQMWTQLTGETPSGVLSVDPVALEAIIAATGPVTFTDPYGTEVTLTAQDTAEFLMSSSYARYPEPSVQDEVFALAAEAVFRTLTGGEADAARLVDVLAQAAREGRLLVWSADDGEQGRLSGTVLSGELRGAAPSADQETSPVVGAFLNMTTAGKLGYYLRASYEVEEVMVRADGAQELILRVDLANVLDPAATATLPGYVTGNTPGQGTIRTNLLVYAPDGGAFTAVTDGDGAALPAPVQVHDALFVVAQTVVVEPGQTAQRVFRIVSGPDQRGQVLLRATPGP